MSQEGRGGQNGWFPVQTLIPRLWQHPTLNLSPGRRSLPVPCLLLPIVRGKLSPHPGPGNGASAACSGGGGTSVALSPGRMAGVAQLPTRCVRGGSLLQERTSRPQKTIPGAPHSPHACGTCALPASPPSLCPPR